MQIKIRSALLLATATFTTSIVMGQEEGTNSASPSTRFWTVPRIQPYQPGFKPEPFRPAPPVARNEGAKNLSIASDLLEVNWTGATERFTITFKPSKRVFITDANFNNSGGKASVISVRDKDFGSGKAIEVVYPNGDRDRVMLFPELPFALLRSSVFNGGKEASVTRRVRPFETAVDLGKAAGKLKAFGTGGLMAVGENPGSYDWLAIADPETRNGVVLGWLTHDRGDGVFFSKVDDNAVRVGAQIDYGRLRVAPGKSEQLETLAVGYFEDARVGLETWADALVKVYDIKLKGQPTGYCTWYSRPHGGAADEKHLAELSAFAAKELKPFGFSVVQIDDGWQLGIKTNGPKRVFTGHNPDGSYPAGMKAIADKIKSDGLVPGIWFMPFAGTYTDPFFKEHQDWFVKREDGRPYETAWGGTCLDMTHPGARGHLKRVASGICRDWGFDYIKIDGLWTGTATRQQYVNSFYRDDNIGDAVLSNPEKTNLEAYRDGLKLVRESIGKNVFILGCNGPQNMRSYGGAIGLVDGMRVGPDNQAEWERLTRGPLFGTRHYFMHGRVWYNDPDPVYVRDSMPLKQAQLICSWVAVSGQLNLSSEWLPGQVPERLDILKRTMPSHNLRPRPADLFDQDLPSLWLLTDVASGGGDRPVNPRRDVVGVFNWNTSERKFDYSLDRLGLDAGREYVGFDYWANALVPNIKDSLQLTVPATSCLVLAVRPRADHPQLISTSRHVTQGMLDVREERWDARARVLRVRSQLVKGDPYELRIVVPSPAWTVSLVDVVAAGKAGPQAQFTQTNELIRVTMNPPANGEVEWLVKFK